MDLKKLAREDQGSYTDRPEEPAAHTGPAHSALAGFAVEGCCIVYHSKIGHLFFYKQKVLNNVLVNSQCIFAHQLQVVDRL